MEVKTKYKRIAKTLNNVHLGKHYLSNEELLETVEAIQNIRDFADVMGFKLMANWCIFELINLRGFAHAREMPEAKNMY